VRELFGPGPRMSPFEQTTLVTQDFAWAEIGSPPRGGISCAAIEASPADTVAKLCVGVVCVDAGNGLAGQRVRVGVSFADVAAGDVGDWVDGSV
jgi:hypothetical protein